MLATSMRQAHCPKPGTIGLREAPVPRPTRAGEVLLRVRSCGICGSELHWFKGDSTPPAVCPGHELTGVVAAVGPEVKSLREGDRVVAEGIRSCGACSFCSDGRPQLCPQLAILGLSADGGFADYVLTDARHVHALPKLVGDETAQLTEPLAVGVHALRVSGLIAGQRVLVLGAGSIGLLGLTAALDAGAGEVAITARRAHQARAAQELGATRVLSPGELPTVSDRFDVVLDTITDPDTSLDEAITAARPGGTVALVGVFTERASLDAVRLMSRETRIVGAMCYGKDGGRADFERALDILQRDGDRLRQALVTHNVALSALEEGFRLAADKASGSIKVSVEISKPESPDPS